MKLITLIFLAALQFGESARILGIFHHPSKSHHLHGSTLLKGLARRGHQVTMVSPFAFKTPIENYTDVRLVGLRESKERFAAISLKGINGKSAVKNYFMMEEYFLSMIEPTLNSSGMQHVLKSRDTYDLIIISWAFNEVLLALGDHFKAPIIVYNTVGEDIVIQNIYGNAFPLSYIPNTYMPFNNAMTFAERLQNTLYSTILHLYLRTIYLSKQEALRTRFFPDTPPIAKCIDNVSLMFVNSHWSYVYAKPELPHMINVGGMDMEPAKQLPRRLLAFMTDASHGVVFFNLGTTVLNFPPEKLNAIMNVFTKLSVKVLWKYDGHFETIPENVFVAHWLPENDILGHPKVKCFVTYGNSLSFTEAIYHGVPLVVIPSFSDQKYNAAKAAKMAIGVQLRYRDLNEESLVAAINQVLYNITYRMNVRERREMLINHPVAPLDLAIYWVEHVIKYKGAPHLKPEGNNLAWYQLYLLDVIVVIILIAAVLVTILSCTIRTVLRQISKRSFNKKKHE